MSCRRDKYLDQNSSRQKGQESLLSTSCRFQCSLLLRSVGKKKCCYLPVDKINSYFLHFMSLLKPDFFFQTSNWGSSNLVCCEVCTVTGLGFFSFLPARAITLIPALPIVFLSPVTKHFEALLEQKWFTTQGSFPSVNSVKRPEWIT